MKKFLVSLLIVVMGITISTKNVNAQCTNSDSVNIDSVYRTHNSVSVWMHVYGSTVNAFRCLSYGLGSNYNTWNTTFTSTAPTVDGIFIITINGLSPNTQYSIQAKLLGSASCASDPVTVTTASCPFSPSISGLNQTCSGISTTLTASPSGGTNYVWKRNGIQVGTGISYNASITGSYTCDVTLDGCTSTSPNFSFQVNGLPNASISPTSATFCLGGSIVLNGSGGESYSWSPATGLNSTTGASVTASPTATTIYTVTATDTNSCTASATCIVTVNQPSTASISPTSATFCLGGSIVLNGSGGESYSWSPATGLNSTTGASVTASPTATTIYTVTATDTNSCTASATCTVNIVQPQEINATPSSSTICHGKWVTLTVSGVDLNNLTYLWLPDTGLNQPTGASVIASPVATTIYTVVATNFYNGCTSKALALVNVNQLPNAVVTGVSPLCAGTPDTISASVGAGYSYEWSTGDNTQFFVDAPIVNTTYTVTVTDPNGCQKVGAKTIIVDPAIFPVISGTDSICSEISATLTVSPSGTPYAYQWYKNGSLISGATNSTYTASATGSYSASVTSGGCNSISPDFSFTVISNPVVTVIAPPPICFGDSVQLVASGNPISYSWSPIIGLSNPNIANPKASPAVTTTYTVTGNNGLCSKDTTITITVNPLPTVNAGADKTVCAETSVTLTGTGTSTLTFVWDNGVVNGISFIPLATETYTLIGTDLKGCENTDQVTVTVNPNPMPTAFATGPVCSGDSTTVNATGGYAQYLWNTGDTTATFVIALPVGTNNLFVTVTDMNGCVATANTNAVVNPNPMPTAFATGPVCSGDSTTVNATAGYDHYLWNTGDTTATFVIALPVGTNNFFVTVTDMNGCVATANTNAVVNPNPMPTAFATGPVCSGDSTTVNATAGYDHYLWNTGDTTATFVTTLLVGTNNLFVTVTDMNGCVATASTSATVNPNPIISIITSSSDTVCAETSLMLLAQGATSLNWDGELGTNDTVFVTPATTTNYSVTGDTLGCTGTATVTITVNPNPIVTAFATQNTICEGGVTAVLADGADLYFWNNSQSGDSISVSPTDTTDFIVIGVVGQCSGMDTVRIIVNPNPVVNAFAFPTAICSGDSTILSATGAKTYSWSNGLFGNSISASPTDSTNYFVIGTDTNGCVAVSNAVLVSVNPLPNITASAFPSAICEGESTQITAGGGVGYNWMPGNLNGATLNVFPTATIIYGVTGINSYGCTNTASVTIHVDPAVHLTTGGDKSICEGSSGIYISASDADNYHWSPANSLSNSNIANPFAFPNTTTFYTVVGTAGMCSDTAFVLVSVIDNFFIDSVYYNSLNETLYIEGLLQNLAFIRIGSTVYFPFSVSNTNAWFANVNLINGEGIYVENIFGCSDLFPYHDFSGISSETSEIEVLVFPNPFSEKFFVELPNGDYKVSLTNVSGQIVREISANGTLEIQAEDLTSGIYFLKVSSEEGNYLTKLIKN